MRIFNPMVFSLALLAVTGSSAAMAEPEVTVIFKNNSDAAATYNAIGPNGLSTKMNASPAPSAKVAAGDSNSYKVKSRMSSDANYASVRYAIGRKVCQFTTSYVNIPVRGVTSPKWNKSAVGSGGARCDVRVTSVNPASRAWTVEFTMR